MNWHLLTCERVIKLLRTDSVRGLTNTEAERRLLRDGYNELKTRERHPTSLIFVEQFKSVLIWILLGAVVISIIIGEYIDACVILAVIILNALIGTYQEAKAEREMVTILKLTEPQAHVIRSGVDKDIPARELVRGDIVFLEAGDKVPADGRLIEAYNLEVDEAVLTGESLPVAKTTATLKQAGATLPERTNMVYTATIVTSGRAKMVVTATGMNTEIGKIAELVRETPEERTPLQMKLDRLGKQIAIFAVIICVSIFIAGWLRGQSLFELLLTSVSLAVAIIPEGLAVVVLLTLTTGMNIMAKRNALIRKLASVETLGCTTVICTDKTGTLTTGEMTCRKIITPHTKVKITGVGYKPKGKLVYLDTEDTDTTSPPLLHKNKNDKNDKENKKQTKNPASVGNLELTHLLNCCVLCNNSTLFKKEDGTWRVIGDPTEGSLITLAVKAKLDLREVRSNYPRVAEFEFESRGKLMTTIHQELQQQQEQQQQTHDKNKFIAYVKGAPIELLNRSKYVLVYNSNKAGTYKYKKLTPELKNRLLELNFKLARKGLRVLAFGYRRFDSLPKLHSRARVESNLVFVGFVGMNDPPREEVKTAIKHCQQAGIRVVMITGDQQETAMVVARELGIVNKHSEVLTGSTLETIDMKTLTTKIDKVDVYARVSPEHKSKIVEAFKRKGQIVAMTGDGVNDSPALVKSDIGIAMGRSGTDVAREASDMVLADDNFATIVKAIFEGRRLYSNIKKFVHYQISTNMGAILLVVLASAIFLPLPLLPTQILYINILIDGPPALTLGLEPGRPHLMRAKPRNPDEPVLNLESFVLIFGIGLVMALGSLFVFTYGLNNYDLDKARTLVFTTFIVYQLFNVLNCRSKHESIFTLGFRNNLKMIYAILACFMLQLILIYTPGLQLAFHLKPLSVVDWMIILAVSTSIILVGEIVKLLYRNKYTTLRRLYTFLQ